MRRRILDNLLAWRSRPGRKPLVLRGARQVGKTWSVRECGRSFPSFLEVNFEEHRDIRTFFGGALTADKILENLSLYFGQRIVPGETLLFFDEVQACPDALRSLRFFHEQMPGLHLVAAGSLLEFALEQLPSFGVGRVEYLYLYPLDFLEFLEADGGAGLVTAVRGAGPDNPLDPVVHRQLLARMKTFLICGGMPEVVRSYLEHRDLLRCRDLLDALLTSVIDDFAKYKRRSPVEKLIEVFRAVASQCGGKFKYAAIDGARSSVHRAALDMLVKAGLVRTVAHSSARGLPLGAQVDPGKFKAFLFDSGIHQRLLGLDLSGYSVSDFDTLVNKGSLVELAVCNELAASWPAHLVPDIYYWHREQRGSSAELDFVVGAGNHILPIEVKSGTRGRMRSLHLFLEERGIEPGIRISGENFSRSGQILSWPAYAAGTLRDRFTVPNAG